MLLRHPHGRVTPINPETYQGRVLRFGSTETGAVSSGSTAIPNDDTIPQNTEGDQIMTLTIVPVSASSILVIDVGAYVSNSAAVVVTMGLFQDSTADALAAAQITIAGADQQEFINLSHVLSPAGTQSATTFNARVGGTSGTTTFNGASAARKLGGVLASYIHVWEIAN